MSVELVVEGGRIARGSYSTYQCPTCHACGQTIVALVSGRTAAEAREIRWEHLVDRVGDVPRAKRQCLSLALLALSSALDRLEGRL